MTSLRHGRGDALCVQLLVPSHALCVPTQGRGERHGLLRALPLKRDEPSRRPVRARLLYKKVSNHNYIRVIEVPLNAEEMPDPTMSLGHPISHWRGSRILLLDDSGSVHSVLRPHTHLSQDYWDAAAALPLLAPHGPIAILGLAGGTVAQLMAAQDPHRLLHGWELDPEVVAASRKYLGLRSLEASGRLVVHVGDALAPGATLPGGFAGVFVDLYSGGSVLAALTQPGVWRSIRSRLRPGGRVMANLGTSPFYEPGGLQDPDALVTREALAAMRAAFADTDLCIGMVQDVTMAITGPVPAATMTADADEEQGFQAADASSSDDCCRQLQLAQGLPVGLQHLLDAAWVPYDEQALSAEALQQQWLSEGETQSEA